MAEAEHPAARVALAVCDEIEGPFAGEERESEPVF